MLRRPPVCLLLLLAILLPGLSEALAQSRPSKKSLQRDIAAAMSRRDYRSAYEGASRCLELYRGDKKCAQVLSDATYMLTSPLRARLAELPRENLPEIAQTLWDLRAYDKSPALNQTLQDTRARREQLGGVAKAYLQRLHSERGTEPVPEMLLPYIVFLPELAPVVSEAALHKAIAAADQDRSLGKFGSAISKLEPYSAKEDVGAKMSAIRAAASQGIADILLKLSEAPSLDEMEKALSALDLSGAAVSVQQRSQATASIQAMLASQVAPYKSLAREANSAPGLVRAVSDKVPARLLAIFPWAQVFGSEPRLPVGVDAPLKDGDCAAVPLAQLRDRLTRALPRAVTFVPGAAISVSIDDVECTIRKELVSEASVTSTYIVGYQQLQNPDYVRIQQLLQQAQAELNAVLVRNALNPPQNGWSGFAAGFEEGTAKSRVSRYLAQLAQTQPFLQQPIVQKYTPVRYLIAQIAEINASLFVTDTLTGFANEVPLTGKSERSAAGVRDVLPSDQSGLSNQEARLPLAAESLGEAIGNLAARIEPALRPLLAQAAFQRVSASAEDEALRSVGYALLAQDLGLPEKHLSAIETSLARFAKTPFAEIGQFRFSQGPLRLPERDSGGAATRSTKRPASAALTKPQIIERSLDAVVTISAGRLSGSGFFVGSQGRVVTNAHVVKAASRIVVRTRSGDSFLATVVKLSAADDLALLAVPGFKGNGLTLAASDVSEVGSEVIAIGSPLGLEGTVTKGIVSAARRMDGVPYLQIDAAINPGSSGGPLLSIEGVVIGITTWKVAGATDALGFAIASSHARRVFAGLLQ
jgi:hypothetical protein